MRLAMAGQQSRLRVQGSQHGLAHRENLVANQLSMRMIQTVGGYEG